MYLNNIVALLFYKFNLAVMHRILLILIWQVVLQGKECGWTYGKPGFRPDAGKYELRAKKTAEITGGSL